MTERPRSDDVLSTLRNHPDFVSGADIASSLGITRAAVWKQIAKLRDSGYTIDASPAKGYRLTATPEYSIEEVRAGLGHLKFFPLKNIRFFTSLPSTNSTAAELVASEGADGLIVVADHQTAGRGRLARTWFSPPGVNIYMSAALRPDMPPKDATILTLLAGVAAASALREQTGVNIRLKWPNDLLVGSKKLGGILTEMRAIPDRIQFAVIGIGINVNAHIADLPVDIHTLATSIADEAGAVYSRSMILSALIKSLDTWLAILSTQGKMPVISEWLKLSCTIGKTVSVLQGNTTVTGIAEDVDNEGFLLVRQSDGTLCSVYAGDVLHV